MIDFEKLQANVATHIENQWVDLIDWLPNLLGAIVILLLGLIVAYLLKRVTTSILKRTGVDRIGRKTGVSEVISEAGFTSRPSRIIGSIIFWLVLFVFLVPTTNMLGLTELVDLFKKFVAFLPKIIASIIIIVFGMMFAQFVRKLVIDSRYAIGSSSAKTLGNLAYGLIVSVIVIAALGQLDINTRLLHMVALVVIAGMILTLVLSIGLGSREISRHLLAGNYAREHFQVGKEITMNEHKGIIKQVGALNTVLETEDGKEISIPNSMLFEHVIALTNKS